MADPDEALIEAIAEAITIEAECGQHVYGFDWSDAARAVYAAVVEHLGLVEEVVPFCDECGHDAQPACPNWHDTHPRRLVQAQWTEVDHGSE